jgi:hypothetical protein
VRQSVYICGIGENGLTKGWVCGVVEKNSDWLGSQDWAPHQGSVDDASCSVVQQGFDLSWLQVTTSAECMKVSGYSLFRDGATNMAGKEPIEAIINL